MANVRVAVRVRPLSKRETKEGGRIIVEVDGKVAKIRNLKVDGRPDGFGDSREKVVAFGFDYCYWSVNPEDPQYASQDVVFQDLGTEVLSGAAKGYNICLFAYGQTGSGKTYTMLGTPVSVGLTPRICEGLFLREDDCAPLPSSCRIKVSFLEIYNERVRDLLKQSDQKKAYTLRVREHPEMGPYVQGLSQHVVTNYKQVIQLLEEGIANRITAATHVHEASSRSHAIFTIYYTQAVLENNLPLEIASKINLVDLAGSERADPSYCKDRLTEGANINKSLVTLGIVISTLAQNSQVFSSCQSLSSSASDGGDSGVPSSPSGTSSGRGPSQRQSYIPYRDSVLTWLLKDSLGGNSRTIMVATVSPAHTSYSETMSTLRYASNAKNIINKPRVNEDANVKLIRELREEIARLKAMLLSFELRNFHSLNEGKEENLKELVLQNELKIDQLTKDWTRKWSEWKALMEHYRVDINRRRAGLVIDSSLPHLMALEDDMLSTGVVLYHLKEGTTKIGRIDSDQEQDIVLQGQWIERDHCTITSACGVVILRPARGARCSVNGREVTASCRLTQGAVITLGKAQKFRFNHPAEAAVLRQRRQVGEAVGGSGSLEWLDLNGDVTSSQLGLCPLFWKESPCDRRALGEQSDEEHRPPRARETLHGSQVQQQHRYLGDLRQRILGGPVRAQQEPELDGASAGPQIKEDQQWLLREETWPAGLQQQPQQARVTEKELEAAVPSDSWCQTDPETQPFPRVRSQKRVVHPQLLRKHALRTAERRVQRRRASVQLERIVKRQRLLEAHRRPEQLRALCWLQDDRPWRPPFQASHLGALVPEPQCRSGWTRCSSLSLQRPCGQHSAQLCSVFLNQDSSTTLPPLPDPTDQLSEKFPSEEYVPQAASYPPRMEHFSKHALCSSGEERPGTARKGLGRKGASAPGACLTVSSRSASDQQTEGMALPEPLQLEEPPGKELENSESDDSQISEDSLAEKGYQSPQDSRGDSYLTLGHIHLSSRAQASVRGFPTPSGSDLLTRTRRSFSLDSLMGAEEELGGDQPEEPFLGAAAAADEMPAETFWRTQTFNQPTGDKEAARRLSSVSYRTGARLDAVLPVSGSFYLEPQPRCEQPELVAEASSSEQAVQLSRGSPLVSMDSWFSCDSKINPSSAPGSLCPSPEGQDFQPCWERPGSWPNMEERKSSGTETALPHSSRLPQDAEPPCSVRDVYPVPASDASRLSLWGSSRLLQPGAEGTFQAKGVPDPTQQGFSEASSSSGSSLLAASATSFTYVGSARERDWAALQQKYLLELSLPILEATGEPRPAFPSLEEDSGSLTQASGRGGDALWPVGPGVSGSLSVNSSPVRLSKIRCLRAEKEHGSLSVEVEGTSDFFTTSEKEASYSGAYSADVESSTSGATNARVSAAESRLEHSMTEAPEVKQNSLEASSQSSKKARLITSSDECFVLKNPFHHIVTIATKDPHWPRAGQLGQNSRHSSQEEQTDSQESSREAGGRHSRLSFPFPSGPELYLHSAPWNPLASSLQPPPLETFYMTKSRDALTETALEIPTCREARVPSPPAKEAWGFGHEHHVLQDVPMKKKLPVLVRSSKMTSSQQLTAERPIDLNSKQVCREKGESSGDGEEESCNSVYFFVTQNRRFLPPTSIKTGESENQVGILNKHSLPMLKPGEKAYCSVSSSSCGSRKSLLVGESEAEMGEEEEQGQDAVFRQSQALDTKRQFPSGFRSDFIGRAISLGLDKDMRGEGAFSLKSRLVHHRVSSSETSAQDERPAHDGEGRNEPELLGKALHPKGGPGGFQLPQATSAYERFHSVTCSQEGNLGECTVPAKPRETWLNPKEEPPGKKRNKRADNADEMARLIQSVMQLEHGILEMESRQSKQLCSSHTPGVGRECVFQDQKCQEMANNVLRTGSSGNCLSFKNQPPGPSWTADVTFGVGGAGELDVYCGAGEDPPVCAVRFVRGHTQPAVSDSPTGDTRDYSGICTVFREPTGTCAGPRRTTAPAGALSSQPRPQRTSEEGRQPRGLGSPEELETVKGLRESRLAKGVCSSKHDEPKAQGRTEETVVLGGNLQEGDRVVSSTRKLPGPCQPREGTFFSQETSPLLSQPDSCTAPLRDPRSTLPLNSARLPRSYPHAPDSLGISSVVYVLDPTTLKMPTSPLVTGVRCRDQSREPGCHGPQGDVGGVPSVAHAAAARSVISVAAGRRGQSSAPESTPLGAEGRRAASTSPRDHRGDLRSTSMGLSSRVGSPSEAEAAVQRGPESASSLNRASGPLERRTGCQLEEGSTCGPVVREEAGEEAEDPGPTCGFFSAPGSLRRVPQPEPSARPPSCPVVSGKMGQAEVQRKQPHDVVARGTVLHYSETLLEPEGSSGAPDRPQCPQTDQSVSDRARHEGQAQGLHVAPPPAEPGHMSIDERTSVLQATPPSADSFHPPLSADTHPGSRRPSRPSSHADSAAGKSHRAGKLERFLGAGEQFVCHSASSEITKQKEEATRRSSSADPLGSDSRPPSAAVEETRRVKTGGVEAALPSQACFDDAGGIPRRGGQFAAQEAAEDVCPGGQESSPVQQEPGTLDNTRGGGPGNFLVSAQGRKTTCWESHGGVQNSASLSGPNQDQVQCLEPPASLEGRVSPKQGTVLPVVLRGVEPEAPSQQRVEREGGVGPGPAEDCRAGGEGPRPTPLPARSPRAVREDTPYPCPRESSDSVVFSGSPGGGRTLSPSGGLEGSTSHPPQRLCSPRPVASRAHSSSSLCCRDSDLGKGASKAAPRVHHSPCVGASRAWGMDERGEGRYRDPDVFLAHELEPKGINVELGPADSSPPEPPAAAAELPLAQGCSSPSALDVRIGSLSCSVADGSSGSAGDPEKKLAERKASTELEAAALRSGRYSEAPRRFQDSSAGGQRAQGSQPKPERPTTAGRQHSEPLVGPQHGCLGNAVSCLPEKTRLSPEFRDHSGSDVKAKYVGKFKYIPRPQANSPWEEEEQQRDRASGGGEDPAWGRSPPPSEEDGSDIPHTGGAGREEVAEAGHPVSKMLSLGHGGTATVPLGQHGAPQPAARVPGQASSGGDQPAPLRRCALPVIAVFPGPEHLRPQFSVISSSRSLQELNLSVEPPSLTDEHVLEASRLWTPPPSGSSPGMSAARPSVKAEGCDQGASGYSDKNTAGPRCLPPAPCPHLGTAAPSGGPTPSLTTGQPSGCLEQALRGEPERLGAQARPGDWSSGAGTGDLLFGSSDIRPCILPWRPEGPECVFWKQCVCGGAVAVSHGRASRCCSADGVQRQDPPFRSHPSTRASTHGLASAHSNTENPQGSHQTWEVWASSFALGNPHALASSGGTAPIKGPDERAQSAGSPGEAGCLRREPPLAEGSATGPMDEVMLLCPSKAGGPGGPPGMSTLEQGTQTLGSRSHGSHPATRCVGSDAASWASMHSLSLHLSQLLHSTSELLGSLSQPSVAERECNAKRETPDEVPQALMMDSCTQTTMDEGVQTDLAAPPLRPQAPEADPQKVDVVLEGLGPDSSIPSKEKGHVLGTLEEREAEEIAWKTAGPQDLQEESTRCPSQSPPEPSSHLSFRKGPFGQNPPSLSPQASPGASPPPSSQPQGCSCLAGSSPSPSPAPSTEPCTHPLESLGEPRVLKKQGLSSALLVDRASSPILTLSAHTQGSGLPLVALGLSTPSAHSLEGHQQLACSPSLPLYAPRPPMGNYSQATDESADSQRMGALCGEGRSSSEGGDRRPSLEVSSRGSPQPSAKLQVRFMEQPLQQQQQPPPSTTAGGHSRLLPPPTGSQSHRLARGFMPEDAASLECGPLSSRGPSRWWSRTENGCESSASPAEPRPALDASFYWGGLQRRSPCPFSELTDTPGLPGDILSPAEACQPEGPLHLGSQVCMDQNLRDLPMHNKFSDWHGVQDGSPSQPGVMDSPGTRCDCGSGEQGQRPARPPDEQSQAEWAQREQIPLQVGARSLSLSVELTEAKLHHGFGETDALLRVLQSGTAEALAAQEEPCARPKQAMENLPRERAGRPQSFRRTRSLSPQKQLSSTSSRDLPTRDFDLPSRRREYLQRLRRDVVETTRNPRSESRSAHPPWDIELMLQEYQRAREEARVEIARARDRLRERTEQEKMRIRQQIVSQLLREEEKLHSLATSSSRCTSSDGSLSSGVTSGYNSSPALPGQLQSPESVADTNLPDSRDSWLGDVRGHSAGRSSRPNLAGSARRSLAYSRRASLGSCCCSPSSLSSLGTSFSSSYKDLAKHIVDISLADVMAACSDNLNNLFSCRAAAGWNPQGEEQEVQLYYKVFSPTRHGFLGAGVVSQPLSHVWAAVSDPTLWPLYHKPIQTARLHQRVTDNISLVYLVCSTAQCALKQPRDFCCVCVEAKEGQLSLMAAQSVYDASMPRPSRETVRGEILPSAWILQPLTVEGKEVTRVIYLAQVELGAPGFPPQVLSAFIKQQPLVIARLASFLGS